MALKSERSTIWFEEIGRGDVGRVGGKNASLGEMVRQLAPKGIRVLPGFAVAAEAYWAFVAANGLKERIEGLLGELDQGKVALADAERAIREQFLQADWPEDIANDIASAYRQLCQRTGRSEIDVAVRSSATAEDLPDASFAGQQETFLNIRGKKALLAACRSCYASLFTDRAISYRNAKGFDHMSVALSIGV